tara:strand:- start:198 stop:566 length:369 start_codon:yes stop_codon:yes gene_type:complete
MCAVDKGGMQGELTPTVDRPHNANRRRPPSEKMQTTLKRRALAKSQKVKRVRDRGKKNEWSQSASEEVTDADSLDVVPEEGPTGDWVILSEHEPVEPKRQSAWGWLMRKVGIIACDASRHDQ